MAVILGVHIYYLMWSIPDKVFFARKDGFWDPPAGIVRECRGSPLGLTMHELRMIVPDPFKQAILLSRGVIADYRLTCSGFKESYTLKRLWRVKSTPFFVFRGHPLKVKT
jgi:hypothetical protein